MSKVAKAVAKAKRAAGGAVTREAQGVDPYAMKGDKRQSSSFLGRAVDKIVRQVSETYFGSDVPASNRGKNVSVITRRANPPTPRIDYDRAAAARQLSRDDEYADGGTVHDEHDFSDLDAIDPIGRTRRRMEVQQAAGPNLTPEQKADYVERTARSVPIISNALGVRDYTQAQEEAAAATDKASYDAAKRKQLIGFANAVLPSAGIGSRGSVAGAASRPGVFVPVAEGTERKFLDRMMERISDPKARVGSGKSTPFQRGQPFISPEGRVKREIPDTPMQIKNEGVFSGRPTNLEDVIDHPAMFAAEPQLRKVPVKFEAQSRAQQRPIGRINEEGGFTLAMNPNSQRGDNWLKQQIAKLSQYKIQESANFAKAGRHDPLGNLMELDQIGEKIATGIQMGLVDKINGAKFLDKIQTQRAQILNMVQKSNADPYYLDTVMTKYGAKGVTPSRDDVRRELSHFVNERTAGNIEARAAWQRFAPRDQGPDIPRGPGSSRDLLTIPHLSKDAEKLGEFVDDWAKYGAGSPHFAAGGKVKAAVARARRKFAAGGMAGDTTGRSDEVPVSVAPGSYVIPADIVAALGEGNSQAGMKLLAKRFPHGKRSGRGVNIIVSHGEYIISPEQVALIGTGDVDKGHNILDDFVKLTRAKNIAQLQNMPEPNQ